MTNANSGPSELEMNPQPKRIGSLDCKIVDGPSVGDKPDLVVILCHGYGAPGDDLVPVGEQLIELRGADLEGIRFIFPAAPVVLEELAMFGGRAWWPLNMEKLASAMQARDFSDLQEAVPEGLHDANEQILGLLQQVQQETGLGLDRMILGGFSQGAMLMTDVALRLPTPPAALVAFSGTLICKSVWTDLARREPAMRILQSHGRYDTVLPFEGALALRDMFEARGTMVDFVDFNGVHTIPMPAVVKLIELITALRTEADA